MSAPREYGKYRLLERIGDGTLGTVWRAEAPPVAGVSRSVALRRIAGSARSRTLDGALTEEARPWLELRHANAAVLLDFGENAGELYFVMELVDGFSSGRLVRSLGALPANLAICIAERTARALAAIHSVELPSGDRWLHRAVRASNVLLSARGEVKLTDIGIARVLSGPPRTRPDLAHLAPEQARGERIDARTDLFCVGAMLHLLLAGRPLLQGAPDAILAALEKGEIPAPDASLDPRLRELLRALTAPDPRDRIGSAAEAARAARALLLPDAPEDLEPDIAAKVGALRGGAVPLGDATGTSTYGRSETTVTTGRGPSALTPTPTPPVEATVTSATIVRETHPSITAIPQTETVIAPRPRLGDQRIPSWSPIAAVALLAALAGLVAGRFAGPPRPTVVQLETPAPPAETSTEIIESIPLETTEEITTRTPLPTPTPTRLVVAPTSRPVSIATPRSTPNAHSRLLVEAARDKAASGRHDQAMLDLLVATRDSPEDEDLLFDAWLLAAKYSKRVHAERFAQEYVKRFPARNPARIKMIGSYLESLP